MIVQGFNGSKVQRQTNGDNLLQLFLYSDVELLNL
ncbi:MAG: hypothetical protein K0Q83_79 [Deltaproteobacteria bacterium]|jgi:hypothetical protein|nr:hypothetical protein [Deltaproteobacteria bacterium]